MTSRPEPGAQIPMLVADRLTEQLVPGGWRRHRFVADDEVAFVREPFQGVVFHFGVNLAGDDGVFLSPRVGIEHAAVAELQRRLFGHLDTVCQVGASMFDLLPGVEPSKVTPLRWWVVSPERVDEAVGQVVADLTAYGEPFLIANQTVPKVIDTLLGRPTSQVEYGALAVCLAVLGDLAGARAMVAKFGAARPVFVGGTGSSTTSPSGSAGRDPASRQFGHYHLCMRVWSV